MRRLILLVALLPACSRHNLCVDNVLCVQGDHWDSNQCKCVPNSSGPCSAHKDEASCKADPSCRVGSCSTCGPAQFQACLALNDPPIACPLGICPAPCHGLNEKACAAASGTCVVYDCCGFGGCLNIGETPPICAADCASCDGLDETSCLARAPYCQSNYCPGCNGTKGFVTCTNPGEPTPICDPLPCPPPLSCDQLTDAASCDARSDCHSVYEPLKGGVAFNHCAYGPAQCNGTASCPDVPPNCASGYVLAYANGCYEGCVASSECH
jgi:hypothetical protein